MNCGALRSGLSPVYPLPSVLERALGSGADLEVLNLGVRGNQSEDVTEVAGERGFVLKLLQGRDPRRPVADTSHLRVLLHGVAADVHEVDGVVPGHPGQHVADEGVDAHALQADGVEHPAWRLNDALGRVACPRLQRYALDDDAAQAVEIHEVVEFPGVSKGSGSGHHRVFKNDAADIHLHY